MIFRLLLITLWIGLTAFAEDSAEKLLAPFKGKFRTGWEIELTPPQLEKIVRYFDFTKARATNPNLLKEEHFVGYLSSIEAFDALPKALRERLEKGISRTGGIILPGESGDEVFLRRIQPRWDALELAEKRAAVPTPNLPPSAKTALFMASASEVTLAKDAPPGVQELFGYLNWSKDQDTMEFRFTKPVDDLLLAERMRDRLGRIALVSRGFNDTKSVREGEGVSYHFHLSRTDGTALEPYAKLLNALQAARLVAADRPEILNRTYLGYNPDLKARGLVRLINPFQMETRVHAKDPAEEVAEWAEIMNLPLADAERRVADELQKTLSGKVAETVRDKGRAVTALHLATVLADLGRPTEGLLTEAQRGRLIHDLVRSKNSRAQYLDARPNFGTSAYGTRIRQETAREMMIYLSVQDAGALLADPLSGDNLNQLKMLDAAAADLPAEHWPADWKSPAWRDTLLKSFKRPGGLATSLIVASLLARLAVARSDFRETILDAIIDPTIPFVGRTDLVTELRSAFAKDSTFLAALDSRVSQPAFQCTGAYRSVNQ